MPAIFSITLSLTSPLKWNVFRGSYGYYSCDEVLPPPEGWSRECLQQWGPYLQLAVPSMLMHCLEWWLYEIAGFMAGIISEVELAAQSVMYQLAGTAYVVTSFAQRFPPPPPPTPPTPTPTAAHLSLDRFHSRPAASRGLLRCCQRSRWKRSWCWEHGASQAVQQGRHHPHTYDLTTVCGLKAGCLFMMCVSVLPS